MILAINLARVLNSFVPLLPNKPVPLYQSAYFGKTKITYMNDYIIKSCKPHSSLTELRNVYLILQEQPFCSNLLKLTNFEECFNPSAETAISPFLHLQLHPVCYSVKPTDSDALQFLRDMCSALNHLHSRNIVHRFAASV